MCAHALCIVMFALLPQCFAVTPQAELHSALSEDANFNDDVARKMSLHINANSRNQHSRGERKKIFFYCAFSNSINLNACSLKVASAHTLPLTLVKKGCFFFS